MLGLDSGARNEEPLINRAINLGRRQVLALGDPRRLLRTNSVRRLLVGDVGQVNISSLGLAPDQFLPRIAALSDDFLGVFLVLAFTAEGKLVLWLSVWDLVDSEPLVGSSEKTWEVSLNVLDIVELGSQRVVDVNDDDLPIRLFFVEESHDTEHLDLLNLASVSHKLTDFADVEWVVVAFRLGLRVDDVGVFPCSWEGAVVPKVALVREAISNKSELALLDVLLDRVEELILGDLLLRIRPSWDLNDHVQDRLLLVGIQGDIVKWRDGLAILLDVAAVVKSVWLPDCTWGVL